MKDGRYVSDMLDMCVDGEGLARNADVRLVENVRDSNGDSGSKIERPAIIVISSSASELKLAMSSRRSNPGLDSHALVAAVDVDALACFACHRLLGRAEPAGMLHLTWSRRQLVHGVPPVTTSQRTLRARHTFKLLLSDDASGQELPPTCFPAVFVELEWTSRPRNKHISPTRDLSEWRSDGSEERRSGSSAGWLLRQAKVTVPNIPAIQNHRCWIDEHSAYTTS